MHDSSPGNLNKELKMIALQDKAAKDKTRERTRSSVLGQMAMLQSMSLERFRGKL
jgi:hypothetical protein